MTNPKDLSIEIGSTKLNVRVGAIIKHKNKIMVERNKKVDFSVIPGGRIKTLETTQEALIRELEEELGLNLEKEHFEFSSFIENYFIYDGQETHELYFVFKVELDDSYNIEDGHENLDNSDSKYYLLNEEEFKKEKILPDVIKDIATDNNFSHYIINDINKMHFKLK